MQEPVITEEIVQQHGLSPEEYERILSILGRKPTFTELGIFSVMWSEHCSYKSSRLHLKKFPTEAPYVIEGPGENAGVIDIGDGLAAVFKMESHNHPSFIEPYQGAATGVGGIMRDVFTMGARPVANMNSLRFGKLTEPHNQYLLDGVVDGIAGYGNCMGVPTIGGEICFSDCYNGNCLVNAFTLGIAASDGIFRGYASGPGNVVIYVGSRTGRDGIHGVTMASEEFVDDSEQKKPTVQVGDPFMEKLLLEACLEVMKKDLLVGIQDMGGAGLTSSSCEMAGRAGTGVELDLSLVPRREEGMIPYEIMLSESQERMLLVAEKENEEAIHEIFKKWDLEAVTIGRVTDDGMLRILDGGKQVAEIPALKIAQQAPIYDRPHGESETQRERRILDLDLISVPVDLQEILPILLGDHDIADKEWVFEQYDHMVRTNTIVLPGSDAAVIRVKGTKKGIAVSTDCNGRYCYLDPYVGGMAAVAEAARNVVCAGARPMAITDCLNFGNPEKPEIMWQFVQAVEGMSAACRALGTPVVSGNVSFYNETKGEAIWPTPTVGMVGLIEDVHRHMTQWFKQEGDAILLVGETLEELGGSKYLEVMHGQVSGPPPVLDLEKERTVQETVLKACEAGLLRSAHDCSEGGLAVALAECCLTGSGPHIGARVSLDDDLRPDVLLFGESQSRIVVSIEDKYLDTFKEIANRIGAPVTFLGLVGGVDLSIDLQGRTFQWPVETLRKIHRSAIRYQMIHDATV
ncbi:MAG: phosphoribosylformylglycinamidine synthase subunit PurL [Deltaproteobacteria bacterium]|nr:phosphoribosylformylglycinamidine synthase subunit PurL [Deltaproteobacteria bacterium]